jgi:hypothetical protein
VLLKALRDKHDVTHCPANTEHKQPGPALRTRKEGLGGGDT